MASQLSSRSATFHCVVCGGAFGWRRGLWLTSCPSVMTLQTASLLFFPLISLPLYQLPASLLRCLSVVVFPSSFSPIHIFLLLLFLSVLLPSFFFFDHPLCCFSSTAWCKAHGMEQHRQQLWAVAVLRACRSTRGHCCCSCNQQR